MHEAAAGALEDARTDLAGIQRGLEVFRAALEEAEQKTTLLDESLDAIEESLPEDE